jgi:hypothetical protein
LAAGAEINTVLPASLDELEAACASGKLKEYLESLDDSASAAVD